MATRILVNAPRYRPLKSVYQSFRRNFSGTVTLLELLRFYADRFVFMTRFLSDLSRDASKLDNAQIKVELEAIRKDLDYFALSVCVEHIDDLIRMLDTEEEVKDTDIEALQHNVRRELATRIFLSVAPEKHAYLAEPLKKWEAVLNRFPDCQGDIEEMNKCFALSRYTAAVFHSLLVVEHGLIALGHHIGVTDPKLGWDATYKELDRLLKNRTTLPANLDYNFLEQTKARLDSMKLAWRNKVNHAAGRLVIEKTGFSDISAEEVIVACRSFMRHLAEGLPK